MSNRIIRGTSRDELHARIATLEYEARSASKIQHDYANRILLAEHDRDEARQSLKSILESFYGQSSEPLHEAMSDARTASKEGEA